MKLHALEFSLTIGCPINCCYCPQKLLLSRYYESNPERNSQLSFTDFKHALNQVRKGGEISFAGMSEPFLNPECADMIVYAHSRGYKISLLTTIVGMSKEDYEKIKDIPFDSFVLHIPDEELKSKISFNNEYMEVFKLVVDYMDIDYYSCHGTVHHSVADIIDKNKYAGISLGNRAGNLHLENLKVPPRKTGRIVCYHGSEQQVGGWAPVMFPDGTLVLCCQDYGMKHSLGNLLTQTWDEIVSQEEYKKFKTGLDDDTQDILCRTCTDAVSVNDLPAIQIGNIVQSVRAGTFAGEIPKVFLDMANSKAIGVYGMGKLFSDHFFQEHWNEGLNISVLSDRDKLLHGRLVGKYTCVRPTDLKSCGDITIIVFVKNTSNIKEELHGIGINKVYFIDEVVHAYEKIIGKCIKW